LRSHRMQYVAWFSPQHTVTVRTMKSQWVQQQQKFTSNNVEATFDFVAKNGNNVERVLH